MLFLGAFTRKYRSLPCDETIRMKKIFLLLGIGLMALNAALAQDKEVSVAAIYDGTFRTEGMDVLRSRNNGTQYTLLNYDRASKVQTIDLYDYETLE